MKNFIKLFLILIIPLFLTGCIKKQTPVQEKPAESQEPSVNQNLLIEDLTQDWQEYQSDPYGFRIKFPPDWQKHQTYPKPNLNPLIIYSNIAESQREKEPYAIFSVSIEEANNRNLEGYNVIGDLVMEGYNKSSLEIDNTQAYLLVTADDHKDLATIVVLKDGYFYRLTWNADTKALRAQFEETFKKIIATFKFIHQPVQPKKWI